MKKITGYRLQVIALSLMLLLLTTTYHLQPPTSLAQSSSPSASLTDKLNDLKKEIASKAAELKSEVTKRVQNKAIIGTITDISKTEVTIQTVLESKIIKYDEFTEIFGAKKREIKIDSLEPGYEVAALGDVDDKNTLVAQKLMFLEKIASNSAEPIWGQIQKLAGNQITVKNKSGELEDITINPQTAYFLGNEEASISDAKIEKYLVARGTFLKDGSLKARFIYFIPSTGFTKPVKSESKESSNSATPSASPK